ncbi:MAG: hypothetical protein R3346_04175 [Candidatus Spechtbacterales bacterium]|nr:hypothetical protein [Candidatus Spechtbacterales bacterium]
MDKDAESTPLWTEDAEKQIEEACEYALMALRGWGGMTLSALNTVLKNKGFDTLIENSEGESTNLAAIATWRLCRERRIKCVIGNTILVKRYEQNRYLGATQRVLDKLQELGGIATLENLISMLSLDGLGETTVKNSVQELLDMQAVKKPFILSTNRRVWVPRN